jgi:hypothetical protein
MFSVTSTDPPCIKVSSTTTRNSLRGRAIWTALIVMRGNLTRVRCELIYEGI